MLLRKTVISDFPKICDLVVKSFLKHEPMCNVLKIQDYDFIYSFENLLKECCQSGLSSVIVENNNNLIATSLACTYNSYEKIKIPELKSSEINKIISILDDLNSKKINDKDMSVYHFIVGTDPNYINRGLSKLVINETIKLSSINGNYKYIIADATNIVSQHILQNHYSYKPYTHIKYSDYDYFKEITDTEYIIRMIKDIY